MVNNFFEKGNFFRGGRLNSENCVSGKSTCNLGHDSETEAEASATDPEFQAEDGKDKSSNPENKENYSVRYTEKTKQAIYTCSYCHREFNNKSNLNRHMQKQHAAFSDICEVCGNKIPASLSITQHRNICGKLRCPCGKIFDTKLGMKRHLETSKKCQKKGEGYQVYHSIPDARKLKSTIENRKLYLLQKMEKANNSASCSHNLENKEDLKEDSDKQNKTNSNHWDLGRYFRKSTGRYMRCEKMTVTCAGLKNSKITKTTHTNINSYIQKHA